MDTEFANFLKFQDIFRNQLYTDDTYRKMLKQYNLDRSQLKVFWMYIAQDKEGRPYQMTCKEIKSWAAELRRRSRKTLPDVTQKDTVNLQDRFLRCEDEAAKV